MRPFLQSGANIIFSYQGEVIAVQDPETKNTAPNPQIIIETPTPSRQDQDQSLLGCLFDWLSNTLH
ncbi:MAG TPA: hypothetical protein G4N96_05925 [Chloroflexi bacterium]|nr:hypothetical protein [Chloroflexota bacterium]